jgi:hypothetical protein
MSADISRNSFRPAQNYRAVVRQQGRLPIDADDTESEDIAEQMLRDLVEEAICTRGSPDDGFTVSDAVLDNGLLDFQLAGGSFYLGGVRLATEGSAWSAQPDWLTMTDADRGFALPAAGDERSDLVWLLGWEQTVTATEDGELLEPALGGPDTTARRRAMWRAMLLRDVPPTCPEAFAALAESFAPGGTLNDDGSEIVSNARLTVGFTKLDPLEDLCRPQAQAGFLGARNEAFRVMLNRAGHYVWGRDNAAPLYRVQVVADEKNNLRKIEFLTLPRDEFGWPLTGMTVELLRWGSLLANKEKAAEPLGYFARVTGDFDPGDDNSIRISTDDDAALDAFLATPVRAGTEQDPQIDVAGQFLFLRVWTGGGANGEVDNPLPIGNAADLGDTGLTLTFSADGLPGDYWVIAARPNTPTRVMPWALLYGSPPAGPRRLIAPLALLSSSSAGVGDVSDCRHRFRPLCEVGACCRVTVGDGRSSFGDTLSIQDAIGRLPVEGGEVCIHPGEYTEHVTITGRSDILITGCGSRTLWQAQEGRDDPLLTIEGCRRIGVRRVAMENPLAEAVLADVPDGDELQPSDFIALEDLVMRVADRPAVHLRGGRGHGLRRCRIALGQLSASLADDADIGRMSAIFLQGRDLTVEHCSIRASGGEGRISRLPAGGIHIAGGSRAVLIRDNVIDGGNGHGITLGSAQYVPVEDDQPIMLMRENYYREYVRKNVSYGSGYGRGALGAHGQGMKLSDRDCITVDGTPPGLSGDPEVPLDPESAGVVQDVRIFDNDIGNMGFSGISSHVFSELGAARGGDLIAVERIRVRGNRIIGCMRNEVGEMDARMRLFTGWGGIALSMGSDAIIWENEIEGNGRNSTDPICGVFIAIAEGVTVRDNRIEANGTDVREAELTPGMRGGIVIGLGLGGVVAHDEKRLWKASGGDDLPALAASGNTVWAPNARALRAIVLGPATIHGNRLDGAGRSAFFDNPRTAVLAGLVGFSLTGADILDARAEIDLADYAGLVGIVELLGGDAVTVINLCVAEDFASLTEDAVGQRLRGGETLVNDNQISLRASSGRTSGTISAVLAMSGDDVSLCDNQIEIENDAGFFLTDGLVFGATVRVDSNRFQERLFAGFLSAVTLGFLNDTSHNQTTHCIMALGPDQTRVTDGNRSLFDLTASGKEFCGRFEGVGGKVSTGMGLRYGLAKQ